MIPHNAPAWLVTWCVGVQMFTGSVVMLYGAFWILGKAIDKAVNLWTLGRYFKDFVYTKAWKDARAREAREKEKSAP